MVCSCWIREKIAGLTLAIGLPSIALALSLPLTAMALPRIPPPTFNQPPIYSPLEEALGRNLSTKERQKIDRFTAEVMELRERPQTVATLGGVEFIPLICGQIKANFRQLKGIGGEINPCLDPSTGKSYLIQGASFSGSPTVSAGIQVGIYMGPSHLNTPVVGQYGFLSAGKELLPFVKGHVQASVDMDCVNELTVERKRRPFREVLRECRYLMFGGLGIDLQGIFGRVKDRVMASEPKPTTEFKAGPVDFTVGVIFKITEHDWAEKIANGASVIEAFKGP